MSVGNCSTAPNPQYWGSFGDLPCQFPRLGGGGGAFYTLLAPLGVERTRPVDPLVGVRSEHIALRLDQVRGQSSSAVAIVVR